MLRTCLATVIMVGAIASACDYVGGAHVINRTDVPLHVDIDDGLLQGVVEPGETGEFIAPVNHNVRRIVVTAADGETVVSLEFVRGGLDGGSIDLVIDGPPFVVTGSE
jgi:hypothetical protein